MSERFSESPKSLGIEILCIKKPNIFKCIIPITICLFVRNIIIIEKGLLLTESTNIVYFII